MPENKKPEKQYYTVKVETITPVTFTYKVFAESPEEAVKIAADSWKQAEQTSAPQIIISKMKRLKATVYDFGTSLVRLVKNI